MEARESRVVRVHARNKLQGKIDKLLWWSLTSWDPHDAEVTRRVVASALACSAGM